MQVPQTNGLVRKRPGRIVTRPRTDNHGFYKQPALMNDPTQPAANIRTRSNGYEIQLAVPGMKKDLFEITVKKGILTVKAISDTQVHGKLHKREFDFSNFRRSFRLPDGIDTDQVTATYEDGILRIELPKRPEAGDKQIEIQ